MIPISSKNSPHTLANISPEHCQQTRDGAGCCVRSWKASFSASSFQCQVRTGYVQLRKCMTGSGRLKI